MNSVPPVLCCRAGPAPDTDSDDEFGDADEQVAAPQAPQSRRPQSSQATAWRQQQRKASGKEKGRRDGSAHQLQKQKPKPQLQRLAAEVQAKKVRRAKLSVKGAACEPQLCLQMCAVKPLSCLCEDLSQSKDPLCLCYYFCLPGHLLKAFLCAQDAQKQQQQAERLAAEKRKARLAAATQARKQHTAQMRKKTKRGQPIMKHRIINLLSALQE